jgi:ribose transport system permease protein
MGVYVLSGVLAAIAGIFSVSRFNSAPPYGYAGVEMTAICAAVIGGTSMNGGEGTIFGAVLGIAMLAVIETATNLLEISPYLKDLITGAILLVAVSIDMLSHRRRA